MLLFYPDQETPLVTQETSLGNLNGESAINSLMYILKLT